MDGIPPQLWLLLQWQQNVLFTINRKFKLRTGNGDGILEIRAGRMWRKNDEALRRNVTSRRVIICPGNSQRLIGRITELMSKIFHVELQNMQ